MKRWLLPIALCVVALGFVGAFLTDRMAVLNLYLAFNQNPGWFHRARYEAIVDEVRKQPMTPGADYDFRVDSLSQPSTLHLTRPNEITGRGQGVGNVSAMLTPAGKLRVVIETQDLGHAGEYGFAYFEDEITQVSYTDTADRLAGPMLWFFDGGIDDHWCRAVYNLD
jgi:hypothetical protein